jgi:hypothetical protein
MQPPVQLDVFALSPERVYSVNPFGATRTTPSEVVAVPTTTPPVAGALGAGVATGAGDAVMTGACVGRTRGGVVGLAVAPVPQAAARTAIAARPVSRRAAPR